MFKVPFLVPFPFGKTCLRARNTPRKHWGRDSGDGRFLDPSRLLSPLSLKRSYSKLGLQARWRSRKGRGHWNLCSKPKAATSQFSQAFRWRGPLSAGQSSPAPRSVGDQEAGHPSGPGTTAGQTAPPYCPGGDKGARVRRKGGKKARSGDCHKLARSLPSTPFKRHVAV